MIYYAGIGSRETPSAILLSMKLSAANLAPLGYMLRSGGADGADTAFEDGAGDRCQIFLPWKGFNGRSGKNCYIPVNADVQRKAMDMVQKYHPAPHRLSDGAMKLMARNSYQVFGENMSEPVEFIVCWTKDGGPSGGTGQAIRIAMDHKIKIYNLFHLSHRMELVERINNETMALVSSKGVSNG